MSDQMGYGPIAVISGNHMQGVALAYKLRMAGIPTETYLSGSIKKQFTKSSMGNFEALVIVRDDGIYVKEVVYGIQRQVEGDIVVAVMDAIDNWVPE